MKNFNEFYEEVIKQDEKELEELRKKEKRKMLSVCGVIFISILLLYFLPSFLAIIIIVFLIIYTIKVCSNSKEYVSEFKRRIINKMVKEFDEFKEYEPKSGIASVVYNQAKFESYDYYKSEDLIEGEILEKYPIKVGEVHTQEESTDSEGNSTVSTLFHGLFTQIQMPVNIGGYVKIHSDKGILGKVFNSNKKIEMDSSEFEKRFDVLATDKIIAMQVLTSDVMDTLINFMDSSKIKYEMTVIDGNIFIRFRTGAMFEPKIVKRSLDYDTLKRYYDILSFIVEVSKEIIKAVERL